MQWHDVTRKIWGSLEGPGKILGGSAPPGTPLAPPLAVTNAYRENSI